MIASSTRTLAIGSGRRVVPEIAVLVDLVVVELHDPGDRDHRRVPLPSSVVARGQQDADRPQLLVAAHALLQLVVPPQHPASEPLLVRWAERGADTEPELQEVAAADLAAQPAEAPEALVIGDVDDLVKRVEEHAPPLRAGGDRQA